MPTPQRAALRWTCLGVVLSLGLPAAAQLSAAWPRVAPALEPILHPALQLAATRLARPSCALLLEDFQDGRTGLPLSATLARAGSTFGAHLQEVYFVDGSRQPRCADPDTLAITAPGSPIVFVCRSQFVHAMRRDWWFAATVLIHESLHALGLREDPPSSVEISLQVEARCGR